MYSHRQASNFIIRCQRSDAGAARINKCLVERPEESNPYLENTIFRLRRLLGCKKIVNEFVRRAHWKAGVRSTATKAGAKGTRLTRMREQPKMPAAGEPVTAADRMSR